MNVRIIQFVVLIHSLENCIRLLRSSRVVKVNPIEAIGHLHKRNNHRSSRNSITRQQSTIQIARTLGAITWWRAEKSRFVMSPREGDSGSSHADVEVISDEWKDDEQENRRSFQRVVMRLGLALGLASGRLRKGKFWGLDRERSFEREGGGEEEEKWLRTAIGFLRKIWAVAGRGGNRGDEPMRAYIGFSCHVLERGRRVNWWVRQLVPGFGSRNPCN